MRRPGAPGIPPGPGPGRSRTAGRAWVAGAGRPCGPPGAAPGPWSVPSCPERIRFSSSSLVIRFSGRWVLASPAWLAGRGALEGRAVGAWGAATGGRGRRGPLGCSRRAPSGSGLVARAAGRSRGLRRRRGTALDGWADSRRRHVVAPLQGLETRGARGAFLSGGMDRGSALGPGRAGFRRGSRALAPAAGSGPGSAVRGVRREGSTGTRAGEAAAGTGQGRGAERDRAGRQRGRLRWPGRAGLHRRRREPAEPPGQAGERPAWPPPEPGV